MNSKIMARRRNIEFLKKNIRHASIKVLTGMDDHLVQPNSSKRLAYCRGFHELGPCANDCQNKGHGNDLDEILPAQARSSTIHLSGSGQAWLFGINFAFDSTELSEYT